MSKKNSKPNYIEVAIGAALIAVGTLTPIPDDLLTAPLGIGLIAHGFHYI